MSFLVYLLLSKASDEYWVLMFKRLLVTFYTSSKSNCQFKDFKKKKKNRTNKEAETTKSYVESNSFTGH